jgi:hypothetical protein
MLLRLETNPVFTQNFEDLEKQEKHWISTFWHARRPQPWAAASDTASILGNQPGPTRPDSPSAPAAIHRSALPGPIFTQDLRGNLQTWSLEDELKVMAQVQAYFHVAHKVRIKISDAMLA